MSAANTPQLKFLAASAVDQSVTFSPEVGDLALLNTGTVSVWIAFDTAAVGSDGDGRVQIPPSTPFNIPRIQFHALHVITAGAAGKLQIVGVP